MNDFQTKLIEVLQQIRDELADANEAPTHYTAINNREGWYEPRMTEEENKVMRIEDLISERETIIKENIFSEEEKKKAAKELKELSKDLSEAISHATEIETRVAAGTIPF